MSFSEQCTELEDIILSKISWKQTNTIEQDDFKKTKNKNKNQWDRQDQGGGTRQEGGWP